MIQAMIKDPLLYKYGWISQINFDFKKGKHKKLCIVGFYLLKVQKQSKQICVDRDQGCRYFYGDNKGAGTQKRLL